MVRTLLLLIAALPALSQVTTIPQASGGGASSSSAVVALFGGCSGTLYLGADGTCHSASAAGFNVFNVDNYNADPTGATDSTTAINNASAACNTNGGGLIYFPGKLYIYSGGSIYNNCSYIGGGVQSTTIRLKAGSNGDMFAGTVFGYSGSVLTNYSAASASGNNTGNTGFSFQNLTLDGNAVNQSGSSYGIHVYGYGYRIVNVTLQNFRSDCAYRDYNGTFPAETNPTIAVRLVNFSTNHCGVSSDKSTVYTAGSVGDRSAGPTDQQWTNVVHSESAAEGFMIGPNSAAYQINTLHAWGSTTGVNAPSGVFEAPGTCINCEAEGSDVAQFAVLGSGAVRFIGYAFQPTSVAIDSAGIQVGQIASVNPFPGSYYQSSAGALVPSAGTSTATTNVNSRFDVICKNSTLGCINFVNEQSNYYSVANQLLSDAGSYVGGTPAPSSGYDVTGTGRTCAGTLATCGGHKIATLSTATRALTLGNGSNDIFNFNPNTSTLELNFGAGVQVYSGSYSGKTYGMAENGDGLDYNGTETFLNRTAAGMWRMNGGLTTGVSATQTPASSGTISILNSSQYWGTIPVNPAGNITGVILATGFAAGQTLWVHNRSAFTVTFAASGTSNVFDGTADVIAGGTSAEFQWNTSDSLWYRTYSPLPALTGDVTTSAGSAATSLATTVAGIAGGRTITCGTAAGDGCTFTATSGVGAGATIGFQWKVGSNGASTALQITDANTVKVPGTFQLQASLFQHRTTVADVAYSVLTSDELIEYTSLTTTRTVTLPTAVGTTGQTYIIKDGAGTAGTNNLVIATTSSQTIDGAAASGKNIATNYGILRVYSNGANWLTW